MNLLAPSPSPSPSPSHPVALSPSSPPLPLPPPFSSPAPHRHPRSFPGYFLEHYRGKRLLNSLICSGFSRRPIGLTYGKFNEVFLSLESRKIVAEHREFADVKVSATARPVNNDQGSSIESVADAGNTADALLGWADAFYRFSRPHTVIGTAVGIISVSLLAVRSLEDLSSTFLLGLLQALIPALLMNIYIVGLNQIYDIDIDKVNKPYLPLASGEYSLATGIAIVCVSACMSLGMGILIGSRPLLWALTVSFVLGTAYSIEMPFLRWKRSAVAAASCILSVRAVVVQLAFYLHMQTFTLHRAAILTKPLLFATGFMCFFSVVIALFKDIPDVEGDRVYGIRSFSVRLGQNRVFWLCIYFLQAAYVVAIIMGITSQVLWSKLAMVIGHAMLASLLWIRANRADLKSKPAITAFYMFVWKLFYAEYLLIPLMR